MKVDWISFRWSGMALFSGRGQAVETARRGRILVGVADFPARSGRNGDDGRPGNQIGRPLELVSDSGDPVELNSDSPV